jgi:hypothetical protein
MVALCDRMPGTCLQQTHPCNHNPLNITNMLQRVIVIIATIIIIIIIIIVIIL